MPRTFASLILLFLLLGSAIDAGPWLREKGTTFSANSVTASYYLDMNSQTYLEYGLTEKTTLVGDIGVTRPRYGTQGGYATVSLRRALSAPDAKSKWAYEVGVGTGWIGDIPLPHVRTGLSWGRGMTWREKSGWMTVEASVIWDVSYAQHIGKLDTTVGLNFTDLTAGMLQLYGAHVADDTIATIAPSLVFAPKSTKFRIQVGSESQIGNIKNSALKIGLWREF